MSVLLRGLKDGYLNEQDVCGMTAISLSVSSRWKEGVEQLLEHGADTELRYFDTGSTALLMAVQNRDESMTRLLLTKGANPDAANYWGVTARKWAGHAGLSALFEDASPNDVTWPGPRVQNAEHVADNHYPSFQIPARAERESLQPGQALIVYVFGPKSADKQDQVKVRIQEDPGKGQEFDIASLWKRPLNRLI